jgi:hypothetical protein
MAIKHTNSKALQNLPKLGFLVLKYVSHLATLLADRAMKSTAWGNSATDQRIGRGQGDQIGATYRLLADYLLLALFLK